LSLHTQSNVVFVKFLQLLEAHLKSTHTVGEYADMLHISAKTLTKYTKEVSTKTPLEIISDRLTQETIRLLSHLEMNGFTVFGRAFFLCDPLHFPILKISHHSSFI